MKKIKRKIILIVPTIIALSLSTETFAQTKDTDILYFSTDKVRAASISKNEESIAFPFSDISRWRYKAVNGKMYPRQYNYSKQKWIGEWELC